MSTSAVSLSSSETLYQELQQEFQQLGQDLQSGDLSAAQADYVTLQKDLPQSASSTQSQGANALSQDFQQLSSDLQSGNLSAAQSDFATIQQAIKSDSGSQGHHHHHAASGSSAASQLLTTLGQELSSGNLSSAQQTFAQLTQSWGSSSATTSAGTGSTLSVQA